MVSIKVALIVKVKSFKFKHYGLPMQSFTGSRFCTMEAKSSSECLESFMEFFSSCCYVSAFTILKTAACEYE